MGVSAAAGLLQPRGWGAELLGVRLQSCRGHESDGQGDASSCLPPSLPPPHSRPLATYRVVVLTMPTQCPQCPKRPSSLPRPKVLGAEQKDRRFKSTKTGLGLGVGEAHTHVGFLPPGGTTKSTRKASFVASTPPPPVSACGECRDDFCPCVAPNASVFRACSRAAVRPQSPSVQAIPTARSCYLAEVSKGVVHRCAQQRGTQLGARCLICKFMLERKRQHKSLSRPD